MNSIDSAPNDPTFILQEPKKDSLIDNVPINGTPWIPKFLFIRNIKLPFLPNSKKPKANKYIRTSSKKLRLKFTRTDQCYQTTHKPKSRMRSKIHSSQHIPHYIELLHNYNYLSSYFKSYRDNKIPGDTYAICVT